MKQKSNLNHFQKNFCFILFPLWWFLLVLQIWKLAPKPILGRQNWVTKAGGRHNLVPGLQSLRRSVVGRRGLSYEVKKMIFLFLLISGIGNGNFIIFFNLKSQSFPLESKFKNNKTTKQLFQFYLDQ